MAPAKRNSLRGMMARGLAGMAMAVAGVGQSAGGYEGGRRDNRRSRGWRPASGSPKADLLPDLPDLRARSRDLERNAPLALGAIQSKVNGVIGTGLTLKSMLDFEALGLTEAQAIALQADIEREFELWERQADWAGILHWRDMQRLIYRSGRVSGDIGIARRYRREPGATYGTRLVLIEGDRICNPSRRADTDRIAGGVQLSSGVVEGYWVTDRHPGEITGSALTWQFVPRRGPSGLAQFLLPYQHQRPGQPRGIPLFAPIVELVKQLKDLTDAEIHAAINDAMLFAFEKLPAAEDVDSPLVTSPDSTSNVAGDDELQLEDLAIITLGEGADVTVKQPSRPNTAFEPFMLAIIKQMGVALELPYELMIQHFSSSFSASRGALEIAWKGFQAEKAWFERQVADQVFEWVMIEAVALGRLVLPGFLEDPRLRMAWLGRQWIGPTRVQLNPQVEANADKTDLEMGTKSRDQIITERTGGDFERKHAQLAYESRARKRDGLNAAPAPQQAAALPPPAEPDPSDPGTQPEDENSK